MNVNIGIDIGKKKCDVCVINGRGKVLERGQYPNTTEDAGEFAQTMAQKYLKKGRCKAACETTGNMWNITYEAFDRAGIETKLANTFKMAIIAKTGTKTDKIDAEKIAQVLRMGMIPECYVPPVDIRGVRTLIRQHVRITQDRTRVINRVHNLLDRYGMKINAANMYSIKAVCLMESASLGSADDESALQQYARQIRYLTDEIAQLDKTLESKASQNRDARLLASMTGMGPYTALLLAVEIADISRFATPNKLVSWAGLCPTVYQSGNKTVMGKIKKLDTNSLVNWALCEAANTAVMHDPRMKAVYESAKKRHAGKHGPAIVVVAHKMITIAWHMLVTRTPYSTRNEGLYKRKLARLNKAQE